jgi:hypothetical protein
MMKGWDLNSIPVDAYNIKLRLFVVYSMLKWDIDTEYYSFSRIPQPQDNSFRLPYDGARFVFINVYIITQLFVTSQKGKRDPCS